MVTGSRDDGFDTFVSLVRRHGLDDAALRLTRMGVPADDVASWKSQYEEAIERVEAGYPPEIVALPHRAWYGGPTASDRHWPAFRRHLVERLGWPDERVQQLDESSSKIIHHTPDPSTPKWSCKGLVIGYVQSGKTTNFTAVMAKAVDVGYNLVIVLSGVHNGLRRQTQVRLQTQLCDMVPDNWVTLTNETVDFRRQTLTLGSVLDEHGAVLAVVKKNKQPLQKLNRWLEESSRTSAPRDVKALIIDDESDQASIQTRTINPLIRGLLDKLPRHAYIGYTATPFANVLVDPAGDDLYPENFILNLPRPDGYFGTETIFGRDEIEDLGDSGIPLDGYDMVRIMEEAEAASFRYRRNQPYEPELTDNLRNAVSWFLLATATRRARGDTKHSTMLVHTSMNTVAHRAMRDVVKEFLNDAQRRLELDDEGFVNELELLYETETLRVDAEDFDLRKVPFEQVLGELPTVLGATDIILDNSRSGQRLDYDGDPVTAIAIGGNTLSRGLTLEGLVVSFFVRAATAYDTLLQMGRWFGYRPGYGDLPRIWMTEDLRRWFRHLATVEHEIRLEAERYEATVSTPRDFGLRIRTHPALLVTRKMGAAVVAYSSYGGRRVQTRYFKANDPAWLSQNYQAADALVRSIAELEIAPESVGEGPQVYRGVPASRILEFLSRYQVHEDSPDLDTGLVKAYVEKQLEHDRLTSWNVAVVAGPDTPDAPILELGGASFRTVDRSKLIGDDGNRADIKTLMSKDHRVLDLPIRPAEARRKTEHELMTMRDKPEYASEALLLLYPINPASKPQEGHVDRTALDAKADVIGLAMVFPGNAGDAVASSYIEVDLSCLPVEDDADSDIDGVEEDTEGPATQGAS